MRTGADREDARVMDHLGAERDDAWPLRDVEVALIARANVRRPGANATRAEREVLRAIGRATRLRCGCRGARPLDGGRNEWRDAAVGWVDDERRAIVDDAFGEPALIVVADLRVGGTELSFAVERGEDQLVCEEAAATVHQLLERLLQLRQFLTADRRAPGPLLRALERRHVVVGPDALQVGAAIRHARNRPHLVG